MKRRLLSGIKPTGEPHIGNYFALMKRLVDLQDDNDVFYFIADYHALNFIQDRDKLRGLIENIVIDYLAIGLDPSKSTIFKQSDVPYHGELAWIFETITTMPYLMRAHAFKDADAKNKEISVGTFNYPMLMAADILLYDTEAVPVGKDQQQHVEIARDTVQKFNSIYGETFILPEHMIQEDLAVIPGIDGRKMSKSYDNTIPLFSSDEDIEKLVMKISTDSKGVGESKNPDETVIYQIHKLLLDDLQKEELANKYRSGGLGYKEAKELLINDLKTFIKPLRERREEFAKNREDALTILKSGGEKANVIASKKMDEVREKIGTKLY